MTELIHKSVRSAFREEMAKHLTIAKIHDLFENHEFQHNTRYRFSRDVPPVPLRFFKVQRVEQYYSTIDFKSLDQANRLLSVFSDVLRIVIPTSATKLVEVLHQYNHRIEKYGLQSRYRIIPIRSRPLSSLPSSTFLNDNKISEELTKMRGALENGHVWVSVASAKELVEYVLGALADDMDIPEYRNLRKYKEKYSAVAKSLDIFPNSNGDSQKEIDEVRKSINSILNGLLNVATGINYVRNADASHGNLAKHIGIQHARLVVGSTEQLISFLLQTYDHMRSAPTPPPKLAEPYDETTLSDPSKRANDA